MHFAIFDAQTNYYNHCIKIYFTTLMYMSVALTLNYIYAAVIVILTTIKHVHHNNIIEAHNTAVSNGLKVGYILVI